MRFKRLVALAAVLAIAPGAMAQMVVSDVARFYRVYDAAGGKPTAAVLQRDYLDAGSQGLRDFIPDRIHRIQSAANLEKQVGTHPDVYANARQCMAALAALQERSPELIEHLVALYPAATRPRVTIVIGARSSGGTTTPELGVILGLEVTCENRTHDQALLADRLSYILAHELVHTQQRLFAGDSVLAASLNEGVADFIGELMSGHTANEHLPVWTMGKEAGIEVRFRANIDSTDLSPWMYNGLGSIDKPGDLGYWVGYRIAKSYYDRAPDKRVAIARLLEETDAKALLRDSHR